MLWQDPQELAFDIILGEPFRDSEYSVGDVSITTFNAEDTSVWLERRFDSIGMACHCHPAYDYWCVIELGRNVKPKYEIPSNLKSNILADDSVLDDEFQVK